MLARTRYCRTPVVQDLPIWIVWGVPSTALIRINFGRYIEVGGMLNSPPPVCE